MSVLNGGWGWRGLAAGWGFGFFLGGEMPATSGRGFLGPLGVVGGGGLLWEKGIIPGCEFWPRNPLTLPSSRGGEGIGLRLSG